MEQCYIHYGHTNTWKEKKLEMKGGDNLINKWIPQDGILCGANNRIHMNLLYFVLGRINNFESKVPVKVNTNALDIGDPFTNTEITYPFPNFNGANVEVWEWISDFILHIIMGVITYPCWD